MYHPPSMRKTGPILILIIGIAALIIDFVPGLRVPDSQSADGQRPIETKLGLDLQGGLRVEYQAKQVGDKIPRPEDLEVIRDIIERRVNATGVSEPLITTQGTDRIVVELPGVSDPNAVRRLVGQTGRLDFVPLGNVQKQRGPGDRPRRSSRRSSAARSSRARRSVRTATTGARVVNFVLKENGREALRGVHDRPTSASTSRSSSTRGSSPRRSINQPISGGNVQISQTGTIGGYPLKEATELVTVLQFGSLPFPIEELSNTTISATLGEQFLAQSLRAGAIGISPRDHLHARLLPAARAHRELRAHLLHARRAGAVPAHPGDADPRRHRRLRPLDRHGGRREHPHLRTDEGGDAPRQVAAGGRRGGLRAGLELDPRLERVEPHHGDDPVPVRVVRDPRLRPRPHHRRARLDVQRDHRHPDDPARRRDPGLGPAGRGCTA